MQQNTRFGCGVLSTLLVGFIILIWVVTGFYYGTIQPWSFHERQKIVVARQQAVVTPAVTVETPVVSPEVPVVATATPPATPRPIVGLNEVHTAAGSVTETVTCDTAMAKLFVEQIDQSFTLTGKTVLTSTLATYDASNRVVGYQAQWPVHVEFDLDDAPHSDKWSRVSVQSGQTVVVGAWGIATESHYWDNGTEAVYTAFQVSIDGETLSVWARSGSFKLVCTADPMGFADELAKVEVGRQIIVDGVERPSTPAGVVVQFP